VTLNFRRVLPHSKELAMLVHELLISSGGLLLLVFAMVVMVPRHQSNPFNQAYHEDSR
jgi:hypothetical protein